jgi:hypothetical protein
MGFVLFIIAAITLQRCKRNDTGTSCSSEAKAASTRTRGGGDTRGGGRSNDIRGRVKETPFVTGLHVSEADATSQSLSEPHYEDIADIDIDGMGPPPGVAGVKLVLTPPVIEPIQRTNLDDVKMEVVCVQRFSAHSCVFVCAKQMCVLFIVSYSFDRHTHTVHSLEVTHSTVALTLNKKLNLLAFDLLPADMFIN